MLLLCLHASTTLLVASLKLIGLGNEPQRTAKIPELFPPIMKLFFVVVDTLPTPTFAIVQTTWLRIRV